MQCRTNITVWKVLFTFLVLSMVVFSKKTLAQENIDNQIVVMFKSGIVSLPDGRDRANLDEATLPTPLRTLLKAFDAQEIAKGIPEFQRSDTLRVLPDGRLFKVPDYTNLFVITLPTGLQREALVDSLVRFPIVVSAEKNQRAILRETIPNDTHFQARQWNLKNTGQFGGTPGADVKATFAWDITKGSTSVILGILDYGIQSGHLDLQGKVSGDAGYSVSHGTHVAGIAGALTNNNRGVAGVDWNAQLVSQRIDLGGIPEIAQAVNDAVAAGARVLNNSWGLPSYSTVLYNAFLSAYQADVLSTVANPETGATGEFPNSFGTWIMNVAATTNGDAKASYSFDRNYTDVGAPGGNADGVLERNIYSTIPDNTYGYMAGTSMATPHVTGIAGLLLAINPNLHNYDLEWIIKRSANDIPPTGRDPSTGYGRVNAYEAVRHVAAPYQITHGNATLTKTNNNIQVTFLAPPLPELAAGTYWVDRWQLEAVVNFNPIYSQTPWAWLSQTGYSAANPNDAKEYMYENSTTSSTTIRTFFYYIRTNLLGQTINKWAPMDPNILSRQYAVLGTPAPLAVTITGPTSLGYKQSGTWTANASGGTGSYTYEWRFRYNGTGPWSSVVGTSQTYTRTMLDTDFELQVKVTSGGQSVYDTHYVDYGVAKEGVADSDVTVQIPEQFALHQNYPNPFNPTTEIKFELPENGYVTVSIFNAVGQRIRTLVDEPKTAGYHSVVWDSKDESGHEVASGVYLYRIYVRPANASGQPFKAVKKMTLLR